MSIITKVGELFTGGAVKAAKGIADIVDVFVDTKGEKADRDKAIQAELNRHIEAMQSDITRQMELEIQDRTAARSRESEFVKATGHMDWMMTFTGVIVLLSFVGVTVFVLNHEMPKTSEHIIINLIGILEGAVIAVITYYFGSSASSRIKDMRSK
jgi:hypothetical protein